MLRLSREIGALVSQYPVKCVLRNSTKHEDNTKHVMERPTWMMGGDSLNGTSIRTYL